MDQGMMLKDQLEIILHDLAFIVPELSFACLFLAIPLVEVVFKKKFTILLPWLSTAFLIISIFYSAGQITVLQNPVNLFLGTLQQNRTAYFFKILFDAAALILLLYGILSDKKKQEYIFYSTAEFYTVLWAMLTGLHLLAMAFSLLMVYINLELVSIAGYLLASFGFTSKSTEASVKYLLFGAVASAIMLYGISLLYGITGTLTFPAVFLSTHPAAFFALLITFSGLLFKIAAAPFHLWAPDVYEGIPAPLAAFFSVAPKAAGFAVLIQIVSAQIISNVENRNLSAYLLIIAIITIFMGNFSAIWQKNAKRMLAYSSIAHTGFALAAIATLSSSGIQACLFYLGIYLFMNFAAFLMVDFLSEKIGSEDVNKFKGLGMQVPLIGVIFVITMISLTGLPPTAGFYAKFFVFSAMWESYSQTSDVIFLVVFLLGLFNTVISLFYYLRIPYFMFFKQSGHVLQIENSIVANVFFSLLVGPLLVLFIKPDLLLNYINLLFD